MHLSESKAPLVAIVDYGVGNLFSVKHACEYVGMRARITASGEELLEASAVILPGVGAFGDAMAMLGRLDLVSVLREIAGSGKPLIGICLGMQLLMTESHEFGRHQGLGIIRGEVVMFERSVVKDLRVPHVGWNSIHPDAAGGWTGSLLEGLGDGEFMYFVHSLYVSPDDSSVALSTTRYGGIEFCSSLKTGNVSAFQFHPERSGPCGLAVYRNLAVQIGGGMSEVTRSREGSK